jgi:hypothetical protein
MTVRYPDEISVGEALSEAAIRKLLQKGVRRDHRNSPEVAQTAESVPVARAEQTRIVITSSEMSMNVDCQDRILLTGAGFTKNFGAPLAKELWGIIFSNPILDDAPDVRDLLREDFDFESVYNDVMRGARPARDARQGTPTWESQQQALRTAVSEAYEYIDEKVRCFSFRSDAPYPINIYMVQEFISKFAGTSNSPGYFFTLNQDLFVERHYYNGLAPTLPGIERRSSWFAPNRTQSLKDERCLIPDSADNMSFKGWPFYYVKLHGSSNWYTGDQEAMVIGRAKQTQIAAHAVLAAYFEAFRSVLKGGGRRLLCVGYSFSDEHVNAAISDGVKAGLRVYVLSPESPDSLALRLRQHEAGELIWRGLAGYFQSDLKALFPGDQSYTAEWKLLQGRFLAS